MKRIHALANTNIMFYCCLWLMVLLVYGTLAQPDMGLYAAQQKYFSSWWVQTAIPLPGGRLTLTVLFLNLVAYLVFKARWRWHKVGIHITHVGALLLLVGGLITALGSREGSMVIPEGETSGTVVDYHRKELAVIDTTNPQTDTVTAFSQGWLQQGNLLADEAVTPRFEIIDFHANCEPKQRQMEATEFKGVGRRFHVQPLPIDSEDSRNRAGMTVRVSGAGEGDGLYTLFEGMKIDQTLITSDRNYRLVLRPEETVLPFSLQLLDFEKQVHPGTQMARHYASEVNLIEGSHKRRVVIQMNQPFRHRGYTFFQSSFMEGERQTTVLAVVKNHGRLFPYIASIVMCLGLMIHLFLRLPQLMGRLKVAGGEV